MQNQHTTTPTKKSPLTFPNYPAEKIRTNPDFPLPPEDQRPLMWAGWNLMSANTKKKKLYIFTKHQDNLILNYHTRTIFEDGIRVHKELPNYLVAIDGVLTESSLEKLAKGGIFYKDGRLEAELPGYIGPKGSNE